MNGTISIKGGIFSEKGYDGKYRYHFYEGNYEATKDNPNPYRPSNLSYVCSHTVEVPMPKNFDQYKATLAMLIEAKRRVLAANHRAEQEAEEAIQNHLAIGVNHEIL